MEKRSVIDFLLIRLQRWHQVGTVASEGTAGRAQIMQRDLNVAIEAWLRDDDAELMRKAVATMYTFGDLTETEYQQIMKEIDGE